MNDFVFERRFGPEPLPLWPSPWVIALAALAVMAALLIVSFWRLFRKAGRPGWACLVPVYGYLVLAEIAGRPRWWGAMLTLCPGPNVPFYVAIMRGLARRFGKGAGVWLGLSLCPLVFVPWLAFSRAQYDPTR